MPFSAAAHVQIRTDALPDLQKFVMMLRQKGSVYSPELRLAADVVEKDSGPEAAKLGKAGGETVRGGANLCWI